MVFDESVPPARPGPDWSSRGIRLLEADPDFGSGLPEEERADVARQVVLPTLRLGRGVWDIEQLRHAHGVRGEPRGFLVVQGAVSIDLAIAAQVCTRLITARELVLLDAWLEESIPVHAGWSTLDTAVLAVLDQRLDLIGTRWPRLMGAILERAAQQVRHALLQQAISQLPRVEDRLLALLWSIADRQGVVRGEHVYVHLPVTHATLAQMIGARRPTVSLGLRALSDRELVRARDGGWLITRDSLDAFPEPAVRPDVCH